MWGYKQTVVLVLFVHRDSSFTESSFTESRSYIDTVPLVPAPPHPTAAFVVEVYKCSV